MPHLSRAALEPARPAARARRRYRSLPAQFERVPDDLRAADAALAVSTP